MRSILLFYLLLIICFSSRGQTVKNDFRELNNKIKIIVIGDLLTNPIDLQISSILTWYTVDEIKNIKGLSFTDIKCFGIRTYNLEPLFDSLWKNYIIENNLKNDTNITNTIKYYTLKKYFKTTFNDIDSLRERFGSIVKPLSDNDYIVAYDEKRFQFYKLIGFRTSDLIDFINLVVERFEPQIELINDYYPNKIDSEITKFNQNPIEYVVNYVIIKGIDIKHEYQIYSKLAKKNKYNYDLFNRSSYTRKNPLWIITN